MHTGNDNVVYTGNIIQPQNMHVIYTCVHHTQLCVCAEIAATYSYIRIELSAEYNPVHSINYVYTYIACT